MATLGSGHSKGMSTRKAGVLSDRCFWSNELTEIYGLAKQLGWVAAAFYGKHRWYQQISGSLYAVKQRSKSWPCFGQVISYVFNWRARWKYRHFPGPRPKPFLGNASEARRKKSFVAYTEWGRKYGDVFRIFFVRQPVVVLTGFARYAPALLSRTAQLQTPTGHACRS